jgi:hypothetical protein
MIEKMKGTPTHTFDSSSSFGIQITQSLQTMAGLWMCTFFNRTLTRLPLLGLHYPILKAAFPLILVILGGKEEPEQTILMVQISHGLFILLSLMPERA